MDETELKEKLKEVARYLIGAELKDLTLREQNIFFMLMNISYLSRNEDGIIEKGWNL